MRRMLPSPAEISYFLEVTNTLNFSRAAERLGISQPSLTLAMKRLEESLGTNLFIRHKRGVHLTQPGKQLLKQGRRLMQQWENIRSETLASQQKIQGYYTIGCHSSIAKYSLPYFLPNLIRTYPQLEIHLKHEISRKITEQVISLDLDLGIVVNPVRHPDLIMIKLFNDEVTLWQNSNETSKLTSAAIICDPELPQPQAIIKQLQKKRLVERMITSSSLEVIATLTYYGCGIGILPERVALSTYPLGLKKIANAPVYKDQIYIVYRHENREVAAIQTIITAIKGFAEQRSIVHI
jgi:LysR family transcriptional regulator, cell division regulator